MKMELHDRIDLLQQVSQMADRFDVIAKADTEINWWDDGTWSLEIGYYNPATGCSNRYNLDFDNIKDLRSHLAGLITGAMIAAGDEV